VILKEREEKKRHKLIDDNDESLAIAYAEQSDIPPVDRKSASVVSPATLCLCVMRVIFFD
jgi:hypothetical protein